MRTMLLAATVSCLLAGPSAAQAPQVSKDPVYRPGDGVSAPVVVKQVKPQYTAEAMRAKIEGSVGLECVVETDGRVGDVTVTRPLDEGLDQEAVKALRQWRFKPGEKDGKAVRVRISLDMAFTLR